MSSSKLAARPVLAYRFGPYELDTAGNELRKFGLRVKLERKPLQLLMALVKRAGEVVTRGDLQRSIWGEDLFVDFDRGLNVAVNKLRAALNDSPENPTYIATVPGGYRFITQVEEVSPTATTAETAPGENGSEVNILAQAELGGGTLVDDSTRVGGNILTQKTGLAGSPQAGVDDRRPSAGTWKRWRRTIVMASVAMITVAIATWTWQRAQEPEPVHAGKTMLVVLPFENLSGDAGQEYFSDGITEELSAQLGNLNPQRLGVIGRTSAMTYKHSHTTVSQIGRDLAVDYVLEGSVRREGNELRVTAQLVHVSDQAHVWAQDYDRDARNLLQLEDEVARNIAWQVGVSISLDQPPRSLGHHTAEPEAHEDYLLGRYYWNLRTPLGWETAPKYFRQAIEKDPAYAAAYAGLAESLDSARGEEAKQAALKAVDLDPASGEARAALGWVELYRELDVVAAEDTLKSAVQMDANYAPAHHTYASVLSMTGSLQQAIAEEKQATTLDPLSLIMKAALAEILSVAGQQDAAERELKLVFDMDPRYPKAHEVLGNIYARKRMYNEAIREYQMSGANGGDKLRYKLGFVYALSGNKREALSILSKLEDLEKHSGGASWDLAVVEIGLGKKDEALALLERSYREHNEDGLLELKIDPIFDPLRTDPRFQDLLRRMKLGS
jgi:TolB-like protein/DNA-binding winged helix-turn-helix (wHTH) protein/Tfp pilus assembly protein PilF